MNLADKSGNSAERIDANLQPGSVCEMSWEAFEEMFRPIKNYFDSNAPLDGCMFETFDPELSFVKACAEKHPLTVWTFMDDGEGGTFIGNGYQYVNRLGYLITDMPAQDGVDYVVDRDPADPEEEPE